MNIYNNNTFVNTVFHISTKVTFFENYGNSLTSRRKLILELLRKSDIGFNKTKIIYKNTFAFYFMKS